MQLVHFHNSSHSASLAPLLRMSKPDAQHQQLCQPVGIAPDTAHVSSAVAHIFARVLKLLSSTFERGKETRRPGRVEGLLPEKLHRTELHLRPRLFQAKPMPETRGRGIADLYRVPVCKMSPLASPDYLPIYGERAW